MKWSTANWRETFYWLYLLKKKWNCRYFFFCCRKKKGETLWSIIKKLDTTKHAPNNIMFMHHIIMKSLHQIIIILIKSLQQIIIMFMLQIIIITIRRFMPCIMPENKMDGIKGLGNGRERKIMGSYIILINYSLRGMLLF